MFCNNIYKSMLLITSSPTLSSVVHTWGGIPGEGGGVMHMKGTGMLVVSLRGFNFRFWSHLGCSGKTPIIFSRKGLF